MSNLLDNVPDSVFICTTPTEQCAPRGVYANRQLNQFFGDNVMRFGRNGQPANTDKDSFVSRKSA